MKAKLFFSTETKDTEQWTDLPFVPRINEWINVVDILKKEELGAILQSAHCWSGNRGTLNTAMIIVIFILKFLFGVKIKA